MLSKNFYINNRQNLSSIFPDRLILIPGNSFSAYNYLGNNYKFRQDSTFLYFAGIDVADLFLIIDSYTNESYLFGNNPSIDDIIWTGNQKTLSELAFDSGIDKFFDFKSLKSFISSNSSKKIEFICPYQSQIKILLSELLDMPIALLEEKSSEELKKAISSLRIIKQAEELEQISDAQEITKLMHNISEQIAIAAPNNCSEKIIVGEITKIASSLGYGHSFLPIVTQHGEIFHCNNYDNLLKKGNLLLVDAGAENVNHYAGDMTRTTPIGGKFSEIQSFIYKTVKIAHDYVLQNARVGDNWLNIHRIAGKILVNGLKELNIFTGDTDDIVQSGAYSIIFPHGIGHHVGLDVHDMQNYCEDTIYYTKDNPRSTKFGENNLRYGLDLKKDMVLSVEPGIYFIPSLIDLWKSKKLFTDFINYQELEKYKNFSGIRIEDLLFVK